MESPDKAKLEALYEWLALDDDDRELLAVYHEHVDSAGDIERARNAFAGRADSKADWAAEFVENCGMLQGVPETIARYFDYESYARDCELGDNGELWVFYNT